MSDQNANIATAETPDFSEAPLEEVRAYLLGETDAIKPAVPAESAGEETAAAAETEEGAETAEEGDAAAETEETAAETAEEETAPVFEFTEGADAETFRAEAETFLEMVDFSEMPQLKAVVDHYKTAAVQAEERAARFESIGEPETVERTMAAFQRVLEYRQDEETGEFVPDASGVVELLNKEFKAEKRQIVLDLNTQASDKYAGLTVFQEFIRDSFGLNEQAMAQLETFFENGGEMPVPRFTPLGINEAVAEAYWKSVERESLQTQIENAIYTYQSEDASPKEKADAKAEIQQINDKLAQIQRGLNADREFKQKQLDFVQQQTAQIEAAADAAFVSTVDELSASMSGLIAKALPFVEGAGAEVTAEGIVALVSRAYSPEQWEAKQAQARLAAKGITHDWGKGRELLDRLYENEQKLARQSADKTTNPRAIENTRRAKANLLRELRKEELQVVGRITQTVAKGANASLDKKLKEAPKFKAALKKVSSDGARQQPKEKYKADTPEDLRRLREQISNPYKAATMGDPNAFA